MKLIQAKLPAMASCLIKKFILDFRLFRYKVTRTALFPNTITAKRIHKTVNCSVCGREKKGENIKEVLKGCCGYAGANLC